MTLAVSTTLLPLNYKFVIDNVDKYNKLSHNHLHGYSAQNRIDTSAMSVHIPPLRNSDASVMLPAQSGICTLNGAMAVIVYSMVSIQ